MTTKEEKYSEEFIDEADELDEYELPEWWDESLDEESGEEEGIEKSIDEEIIKNDYTKWL